MITTNDDIEMTEDEIVYESAEKIHPTSIFCTSTMTRGKTPIYTKVVVVKRESKGIKQTDSKLGKYANIASYALNFVGGIKTMVVSQIVGAVGMTVSSDTYTEAKTFISYKEYEKRGQARWADEGFSTYVASGKRDYYKHVLAGKKTSSGSWTTKTKDYTTTPSKTIKGTYYNNSNAWFESQAKSRINQGVPLVDLPW